MVIHLNNLDPTIDRAVHIRLYWIVGSKLFKLELFYCAIENFPENK
jgi:hypothetical protein